MFAFLKPKKKEPVERHFIPEPYIMELLQIMGKGKSDQEPSNQLRHLMWKKVQEALPEVDIVAGGWHLDTLNILAPSIRRIS